MESEGIWMDSSLSKYKWSSGAAILGVLFVFILLNQIFPRYQEWILGILMVTAFVYSLYRFLATGERFILGVMVVIVGLGINYFFIKNKLLQPLIALIILLPFLYFLIQRGKIEGRGIRLTRSYQILGMLMVIIGGVFFAFFPWIKTLLGLPLAGGFLAFWLILVFFLILAITRKQFPPSKTKPN